MTRMRRRVAIWLSALLVCVPATTALSAPKRAAGGARFADAPTLEAGTYSTRLLAGETLFYAVEVPQGRRLSAQVTFDSRGPHEGLPIRVRIYNPLRTEDPFAHRAGLLLAGGNRSFTTGTGVVGRDPAYPEPGLHHLALTVGGGGATPTEIVARLKLQIERREAPVAAEAPRSPAESSGEDATSGLLRLFLIGALVGVVVSWIRGKLRQAPRSLRHGL